MAEQIKSASVRLSGLRSLLFFGIAVVGLGLIFAVLVPEYSHAPPIAASNGDITLVVEGGKELDGIVTMLTTLTTALFVLVAIAARGSLRPTSQPSKGHVVLMTIFGTSATCSYYEALHARFTIAEGILAKSLDLPFIEHQIGFQALAVAFAGASALSLIADTLVTVKM